MDQSTGRSIRSLLPESLERMDEVVKERLSQAPGEKWGKVPGFAWECAGSRVTEAVREALDYDVFALVARGWAKAVELREYADPDRHPAGKLEKLFLFEHKLVASVDPMVEVGFVGLGGVKLKFTLELAAHFRSAELRIENGAIVEIAAGDCSVGVQLKYGKINLHEEVKTEDVRLSAAMRLDPPLVIPR